MAIEYIMKNNGSHLLNDLATGDVLSLAAEILESRRFKTVLRSEALLPPSGALVGQRSENTHSGISPEICQACGRWRVVLSLNLPIIMVDGWRFSYIRNFDKLRAFGPLMSLGWQRKYPDIFLRCVNRAPRPQSCVSHFGDELTSLGIRG